MVLSMQIEQHGVLCLLVQVLKRSGNKYIQTASSQAYSQYGTEVVTAQGDKIDLTNLKKVDILVFQRGGSAKGTGHCVCYR